MSKNEKHRLKLNVKKKDNRMKYIFTILVGLILVVSCQNATDQNEKEQNSKATNKPIAVPNSLTKLYTPNNGVLRGIDFSSSRNQILDAEKSSNLRESGSNVLKYSIDLSETGFADIEYFFNNGKLHKIQVDIFGENEVASNLLCKDIKRLFNQKYKIRKSIWEGSEGSKTYTIFAKQVKNGVYIVYELI